MATIRDFIVRDLRERIGSGAGLPADLTLAALSGHYRVSPTPVREALRELVAQGVLLRLDDGRVSVGDGDGRVDAAGDRGPGEALAPRDRAEELERALAAEVIARSLRNEADYLREEATAARHGVGRTAIRQAFGRLAGRGLILHVPRCGWRVRPFDAADLASYLAAREVLELKALELARPRLVEADLRRMLADNAGDAPAPRLDNSLHRYLIDRAENPYIRDFFDRHGPYFTALFDFAAPETHVVAEMARQHGAILAALIDGDWPAARRHLALHIRAQGPIVEELLRRLKSRDTSGPPDSSDGPSEFRES